MARVFLNRMRGGEPSPPRATWGDICRAWLGSAFCMACLACLEQFCAQEWNLPLLIGSFGASAVLAFGAPLSPLAQPRNLLGGHLLSALVGVGCQMLLGDLPVVAATLAVSSAIALMHATKTLHPPGGATALIAVIGGEGIHQLGWGYVLLPCGGGALLMLLAALVVNNLSGRRRWPLYWR